MLSSPGAPLSLRIEAYRHLRASRGPLGVWLQSLSATDESLEDNFSSLSAGLDLADEVDKHLARGEPAEGGPQRRPPSQNTKQSSAQGPGRGSQAGPISLLDLALTGRPAEGAPSAGGGAPAAGKGSPPDLLQLETEDRLAPPLPPPPPGPRPGIPAVAAGRPAATAAASPAAATTAAAARPTQGGGGASAAALNEGWGSFSHSSLGGGASGGAPLVSPGAQSPPAIPPPPALGSSSISSSSSSSAGGLSTASPGGAGASPFAVSLSIPFPSPPPPANTSASWGASVGPVTPQGAPGGGPLGALQGSSRPPTPFGGPHGGTPSMPVAPADSPGAASWPAFTFGDFVAASPKQGAQGPPRGPAGGPQGAGGPLQGLAALGSQVALPGPPGQRTLEDDPFADCEPPQQQQQQQQQQQRQPQQQQQWQKQQRDPKQQQQQKQQHLFAFPDRVARQRPPEASPTWQGAPQHQLDSSRGSASSVSRGARSSISAGPPGGPSTVGGPHGAPPAAEWPDVDRKKSPPTGRPLSARGPSSPSNDFSLSHPSRPSPKGPLGSATGGAPRGTPRDLHAEDEGPLEGPAWPGDSGGGEAHPPQQQQRRGPPPSPTNSTPRASFDSHFCFGGPLDRGAPSTELINPAGGSSKGAPLGGASNGAHLRSTWGTAEREGPLSEGPLPASRQVSGNSAKRAPQQAAASLAAAPGGPFGGPLGVSEGDLLDKVHQQLDEMTFNLNLTEL